MSASEVAFPNVNGEEEEDVVAGFPNVKGEEEEDVAVGFPSVKGEAEEVPALDTSASCSFCIGTAPKRLVAGWAELLEASAVEDGVRSFFCPRPANRPPERAEVDDGVPNRLGLSPDAEVAGFPAPDAKPKSLAAAPSLGFEASSPASVKRLEVGCEADEVAGGPNRPRVSSALEGDLFPGFVFSLDLLPNRPEDAG